VPPALYSICLCFQLSTSLSATTDKSPGQVAGRELALIHCNTVEEHIGKFLIFPTPNECGGFAYAKLGIYHMLISFIFVGSPMLQNIKSVGRLQQVVN